MPPRRHVFALLSLTALAFLAPDVRADEAPVHVIDGLAVGGLDPISYFESGRPVMGSADHAVIWRGAEWRFVSDAHREAFESNPLTYAPQYGGYCAYAMTVGALAPGDPAAWAIENGRLYLTYNQAVRDRWAADAAANIRRADAHWPAALKR